MPTTHKNIAIVDKNPVIRTGLVDIITRDGRFVVEAAVSTGGNFLSLIESQVIHIAILGWQLPDMTGGDVLAELKKRKSPVRSIIYTGEPGVDVLRRTIKAGAWGFMSNMSWWGGPPGSHTKMTAGSLVVWSAARLLCAVSGPIAALATATEPNFSISRRLGPGQGG